MLELDVGVKRGYGYERGGEGERGGDDVCYVMRKKAGISTFIFST